MHPPAPRLHPDILRLHLPLLNGKEKKKCQAPTGAPQKLVVLVFDVPRNLKGYVPIGVSSISLRGVMCSCSFLAFNVGLQRQPHAHVT